MGGIKNLEGVMAIGVGYVFILTPVIIVFLMLRTQQNALEKRLDALVQMSRIAGEALGVDEISQSLVKTRGKGQLQRWGIILVATALGVCGATVTGLNCPRRVRLWDAVGKPHFSCWRTR
jgi:hypothetical protein